MYGPDGPERVLCPFRSEVREGDDWSLKLEQELEEDRFIGTGWLLPSAPVAGA